MSSGNSLEEYVFKEYEFKEYVFLMSSTMYFTPVTMGNKKLIIAWKITSVKIHLSLSWLMV